MSISKGNKNSRSRVIMGFKRYPKWNFTFILNFNKINTCKFLSNSRIISSSQLNQLLLKFRTYLTCPKEKWDLLKSAYDRLEATTVALYGYREKWKTLGPCQTYSFSPSPQKTNKHLKSNCKRVLSKAKHTNTQSKRASALTKRETAESTERDASSSFNAPSSRLVVLRQLRSCEKNP